MDYVNIGGVSVEKTAMLAPMASVSDWAYRTVAAEFGAAYTVSEMVSAKALCYGDKKSLHLMKRSGGSAPFAIQLFGNEPDIMAKAAKLILPFSPDIIDINMGCPVPKVAGSGCGCSLMKTPKLAYELVYAVKNAVSVPVTVKFRKGWDDASVNAVDFALLMQKAGADAVTVHGRTKQQMYRPPVDRDIIKAVKEAVDIPVIGNGGIYSAEDAISLYHYTGCDLVAVAQGSYGKPWLFDEIRQAVLGLPAPPQKSLAEKIEIMLKQVLLMIEDKGEYVAMKEARRQAAFYIKGEHSAAAFRQACSNISCFGDLQAIADALLSGGNSNE